METKSILKKGLRDIVIFGAVGASFVLGNLVGIRAAKREIIPEVNETKSLMTSRAELHGALAETFENISENYRTMGLPEHAQEYERISQGFRLSAQKYSDPNQEQAL